MAADPPLAGGGDLPLAGAEFRQPRLASGHGLAAETDDVITAIMVLHISGCTVPEICAIGGITVDDFTSSVAHREIFG